MPTFARFAFIVAICCISRAASSQDDRYADWRSAEQSPAEVDFTPPPATVDPPAWNEPVGDPPAEAPPAAPRKLPFRFARAPANFDHTKVVHAAATEARPSPLSKPKDPRPLAIKPRSSSSAGKRTSTGLQSGVTIAGSLAIVVGLFLIVAWMARRGMPKQPPLLPREAVEVLGRQRFGGKQQEVQLVRVGNKLVLVHIVAGHVEPLTEITDPAEVDRLTGLCYQANPYSSSRRFQQTFEQFAKDRPAAPSRSTRDLADKFDLSMFDDMGRSTAKTA